MVDIIFKKGMIPWNKGRKLSEEHKRKLSEVHRGKAPWNKGKKGVFSEEIRKKHSDFMKNYYQTNKHPMLGRKQSKESIEKSRASRKKRLLDPEFRKRLSESRKGQKAWKKGISPSEETRRKMRLAGKGKTSWLGKKHSEESKRKMSEVHIGKRPSEETRKKISESYKKVWANLELRKKRAEAHKKIMASPGHRQKMSEASKKNWINPEYRKKIIDFVSTLENREKSRKRILKQFEAGNFPGVQNTKPERQIKEELIKRGYKEGTDFIHQYKFMNKFMCDFCFPQQKVIVEVNGDYWHANPKKYSGKELHPRQRKALGSDKAKEAYITKVDNSSWTFLSFWESDINKDVVKCVDKIKEVLDKKDNIKKY